MKHSNGYTLLELIITISIVGVIAVSVISRFASDQTFALKTEQENLIAALTQSQQLAMSGQAVEFAILSATSFTVRDADNPSNTFDLGSFTYPQSLRTGITFSTAPLVLNYNRLGEIPGITPAFPLGLQAGTDSLTVCVEPSGYAYGC